MKSLPPSVLGMMGGAALAVSLSAQTQPATVTAGTDLYHVSFSKAVPGEAAALGTALAVPDKTSPMPDHFVVLRHQEGDDWDYLVIQHLGQKVTIDAAPTPDLPPASKLRAWHNDTFVSGPSWGEFTKAMGLGSDSGTSVYTVGVHRPVPGHREQLLKALSAPGAAAGKIQTGDVLLQHVEGGDWSFLSITRHNSWQDFATDHATAAGGAQPGWGDVRQHSAFHRDTIADRIHPK